MDWLERKIEAIARDRRHGAAQLADQALEVLATLCRHGKAPTPENLAHQVAAVAMRLARTRPSMAAIHNWCLVFAQRFTNLTASAGSLKELRGQGVQLGAELRRQRQGLLRQQIEVARPLLTICRSLVTLSYSSTVQAILRETLPEGSRVTIAESRPLLEGRRLFTALLESHPSVRMVTDAQLGLTIPAADLVFVGADSILSDLGVVNKTGTYLAALIARAHHRPFYVAADTFKIQATVDSRTCVLESKPGREVWPRHAQSSDNVYFDITPGHLVSGFLTESGILDGPGMAACVQRWRDLFASLRL
jgi:translation initiation factor 2B subunit (eIF-2B alpha/beta/delta family)